MSAAPLNTQLIEQRLRDAVPELESVAGVSDYAQIKSLSGFRPGSAFVLLAAEKNPVGDAPQATHRAAAVVTFGVVVAARNYRDQTGSAALDEINTLLGQIREKLIGWAPQSCTECIWLQGDALDSDRETVLWCDVYTTTHILGSKP